MKFVFKSCMKACGIAFSFFVMSDAMHTSGNVSKQMMQTIANQVRTYGIKNNETGGLFDALKKIPKKQYGMRMLMGGNIVSAIVSIGAVNMWPLVICTTVGHLYFADLSRKALSAEKMQHTYNANVKLWDDTHIERSVNEICDLLKKYGCMYGGRTISPEELEWLQKQPLYKEISEKERVLLRFVLDTIPLNVFNEIVNNAKHVHNNILNSEMYIENIGAFRWFILPSMIFFDALVFCDSSLSFNMLGDNFFLFALLNFCNIFASFEKRELHHIAFLATLKDKYPEVVEQYQKDNVANKKQQHNGE